MEPKLKPLPETILLETTNHCNLKCKMCPQGHNMVKNKGFMSMELFKKAIDEIKSIKGYHPQIGLHATGEPLLHKNFSQMVRYVNDAGFYTMIHTNGCLLNEALARDLVVAGISEITFSFEGEDPEKYPQIRVGSNFDTVDKNIKYFLKIKNNTRVIIEILKFRGIDQDLAIKDEFKDQYPGAEFNSYFASNWHGTLNDEALRENEIHTQQPEVCPSVLKNLIVAWDGKIHPCGKDFDNRLIIGDLQKETIIQHWNGTERQRLFEKMKQNEYSSLKLCKNCSAPFTVRTKERALQQ
ncbi:radical SAM protein [Desulfobacter sp.]|uniref:radical SAM protein n=1 Tax=Desulfobacter sp. TaxID=2294 RepID=UPI000E8A7261|nr:radical SAM protein [Desulfobacter sp.]HBT87878.1 hypothetical protein [Desulfobacter sp.]